MRAHIESAALQSCPENRGRSLEAIGNEIDGMLRLISATLEISRTEAGIGRQNFARFDLGALLQDLCEMYQPLAEESGVSLEVEERRPIDYLGNRELMGRALSNLIDNALKYGRQGGEVRIGAAEDPDGIRLWVADRGPGIPEERRDEALRRYGRLEEARTTEGSGLGLALVAAIARLHGGELLLEDNAPGLRALVLLPRSV
jgi:signal transduction histidine kinase